MYGMSHHYKCKNRKTFRNENVRTNYQYQILKSSFEVTQIKSILSVFGINYKEIFEKHGHKNKGLNNKPKMKEKMRYNVSTQTRT